jgi:hypothetical protein
MMAPHLHHSEFAIFSPRLFANAQFSAQTTSGWVPFRFADPRFEHVNAAVSGIIEDELSPKTIHNAVTLLRTILTGKQGPSALRRGVAFRDSALGIELPPLQSRQITPPTPEQTWKLINTAKEIGGVGYLKQHIDALVAEGSPVESICVMARTQKFVETYMAQFNAAGMKTYRVKADVAEQRDRPGVRLATMHRVKGLEFDHVIVASFLWPSPCRRRMRRLRSGMQRPASVRCCMWR